MPSAMSASDRYQDYCQKEVMSIEAELKDWFLQRRFSAERNVAIKKALDDNNFTGLSINNASAPEEKKVMWSDLVQGKPELEDSLSNNAKQMKAELYTSMFKESTDLDHPCRIPGSVYLKCLQDNTKTTLKNRTSIRVEITSVTVLSRWR